MIVHCDAGIASRLGSRKPQKFARECLEIDPFNISCVQDDLESALGNLICFESVGSVFKAHRKGTDDEDVCHRIFHIVRSAPYPDKFKYVWASPVVAMHAERNLQKIYHAP